MVYVMHPFGSTGPGRDKSDKATTTHGVQGREGTGRERIIRFRAPEAERLFRALHFLESGDRVPLPTPPPLLERYLPT